MNIDINRIIALLQRIRRQVESDDALAVVEQIIEEVTAMNARHYVTDLNSRLGQSQSKAIARFVRDCIEFREDTFCANAGIYERWQTWANACGLSLEDGRLLPSNAFSRRLGWVIGENARRGRLQPRQDGKTRAIYGWFGLRLQDQPTPGGIRVEDVKDSADLPDFPLTEF